MSVKLPPFQALLDEHRVDVYRFLVATAGPTGCRRRLPGDLDRRLRAYPRLRRADNLRAWLLSIAHNKAIDAHRARGRRALPMAEPPEQRAVAAPVADGRPELWERVRELPSKQRTAVFCRAVLGMSYAELAALLDSSEEAARRNVHEGLKRLRRELSE